MKESKKLIFVTFINSSKIERISTECFRGTVQHDHDKMYILKTSFFLQIILKASNNFLKSTNIYKAYHWNVVIKTVEKFWLMCPL